LHFVGREAADKHLASLTAPHPSALLVRLHLLVATPRGLTVPRQTVKVNNKEIIMRLEDNILIFHYVAKMMQ